MIMYLKQLKLINFKNCAGEEFEFSDRINCFAGNNGTGKTNILDAIYYLSFCKSYFNPVDMQNIKHGEDFFAIHGTYLRNNDQEEKLSCLQQRSQRKKFKCNGKEYERLADHIGLFPLVMVSPYDRDLINDGSEIRRRLIDSIISQFNRLYLDDLISYNKALQHRNSLIRDMADQKTVNRTSLEIWDEQLSRLGAIIMSARREFNEGFVPLFRKYYSFISGEEEDVNVEYDSDLLNNDLSELLQSSLERDLALKYTTRGIHKDDLRFTINGYPVKKFGSQGQQKSFVLALRLAQYDYISDLKGYKPIILLDDIFDKLDEKRVQQIIQLVGNNNFGQVFITDTQNERIESIFRSTDIEYRIFEIENGKKLSSR